MNNTENIKRELAFILFSQKRVIFQIWLMFIAVSVAVAFLPKNVYMASGTILVKGKQLETTPDALESTQLRPQSITKEDLYSEAAIMTSRGVMMRAIKVLEEMGQMAFLAELGPDPEKRVMALKSRIEANVVPTSNVIQLTFRANDPRDAENALRAIMNEYILERININNPTEIYDFMGDQVTRFREDLEARNREISDLVRNGGATAASLQIENNLLLRRELETRIHGMQDQIEEINAQTHNIDQQLDAPCPEDPMRPCVQFFSFINNPGILALGTKLQDLAAEEQSLLRRYTPESRVAVQARRHVQNAFDVLVREVKSYQSDLLFRRATLLDRVESLEERIGELEDENIEIRTVSLTMEQLQQDAALARMSYETFFKRQGQLQIGRRQIDRNFGEHEEDGETWHESGGGEAEEPGAPEAGEPDATVNPYLMILVQPNAPNAPVFPRPEIIIPFGVLAGLLLGVTIGFFYEYASNTIKRPEDVARFIGLPLIFSIPERVAMETSFFKNGGGKKGAKRAPRGKTAVLALAGVMLMVLALTGWPFLSETTAGVAGYLSDWTGAIRNEMSANAVDSTGASNLARAAASIPFGEADSLDAASISGQDLTLENVGFALAWDNPFASAVAVETETGGDRAEAAEAEAVEAQIVKAWESEAEAVDAREPAAEARASEPTAAGSRRAFPEQEEARGLRMAQVMDALLHDAVAQLDGVRP